MYFFLGAPLKGTPVDIMQQWKDSPGEKHSSLLVSDDENRFCNIESWKKAGREREREREIEI